MCVYASAAFVGLGLDDCKQIKGEIVLTEFSCQDVNSNEQLIDFFLSKLFCNQSKRNQADSFTLVCSEHLTLRAMLARAKFAFPELT